MNDDSNILENLFCFGIIFSVYSSIMQECLEKDYRGSYSTNLEDEAAVKYKKIYVPIHGHHARGSWIRQFAIQSRTS